MRACVRAGVCMCRFVCVFSLADHGQGTGSEGVDYLAKRFELACKAIERGKPTKEGRGGGRKGWSKENRERNLDIHSNGETKGQSERARERPTQISTFLVPAQGYAVHFALQIISTPGLSA